MKVCKLYIYGIRTCILCHSNSTSQAHAFTYIPHQLAGASYMELHEAGGGIMFTVDKVSQATEEDLYKDFCTYLQRMMEAGTTLAECKSGYGLNADTEIKMLRVLERGKKELDIDISTTYCGAHAVPKYTVYNFIKSKPNAINT